MGYAEDNGRDGWAETIGREGAQNKQVEQFSVRGKLSRPSENVAHANSDRTERDKSENKGAGLSKTVQMWPTPTTRDHKGGYLGGRMRNGKVSMDTLDVAVQYTDNQQKNGGQLNPTWVEWLMGYPSGWTDLKD